MTRRLGFAIAVAACICLLPSSRVLADMLTITPEFTDDPTQLQKDLYADAIKEWTDCLMAPTGEPITLTIKVTFADLGTDTGGGTNNLKADANGNPMSADMEINTNAVMYYGLGLPVPNDKFDVLSIMKHEIGHALGFAGGSVADGLGYEKWNDQLTVEGTNVIFDKGGMNIMMAGPDDANGRSHLDPGTYPNDLMIPVPVQEGQRKAPTGLDFMMLSEAFGYQVCPEPSTFVVAAFGALGLFGYGTRQRKRAAAA
jgi:hypothetical protein